MTINLNPKIGQPDIEQVPTRNGYGEALLELGTTDERVVVLTADLAESTRVLDFAKKFPERFIECGVAEQNMMGLAAGLALYGKIPFVSSYAVFSPGRSWDQMRVSVCYSQANVKIAGAHTGISVGPDGATHQALEDVAITRVLPNLTVIVPCDTLEAKKTALAAARMQGPVYFRFGREKTAIMTTVDSPFEIGKAYVMREGSDVAVIGSGPVLYNGLLAAMELEKEGISVMVINNHTIKPIDVHTITSAAKKCGAVVTLEEHQVMGGCGSAVCEVLAQHCPVPVEMVGMQNTFGESGKPDELIEKYGMGKNAVIAAVRKVFKRKLAVKKSGAGFTLIELLVVISIIGLLASVVLVALNGARQKARVAKRVADLKQIATALELYNSDNNSYPNTNYPTGATWRSQCAWNSSPFFTPNLPPSKVIWDIVSDPTTVNNKYALVPNYISAFPPDPVMNAPSTINCYAYTSNGTDYKLMDWNLQDMTLAQINQYPGFKDPLRNDVGGANCGVSTDPSLSLAIWTPGAKCW